MYKKKKKIYKNIETDCRKNIIPLFQILKIVQSKKASQDLPDFS